MTYQVSVNDEALGCVSDIAEWITGDQMQLGSTGRLERRGVVRWKDRGAGNSISVSTFHSTDFDLIARVNSLQRSKMSISMAGNYAVALRARYGGTLKMPRPAAERCRAGTLDYIQRRMQAWYPEACKYFSGLKGQRLYSIFRIPRTFGSRLSDVWNYVLAGAEKNKVRSSCDE